MLAAGNISTADIVRVTCYVTRAEDLPDLYEAKQVHLTGARPAVTTVIVADLASPDFLVEIGVTAAAI